MKTSERRRDGPRWRSRRRRRPFRAGSSPALLPGNRGAVCCRGTPPSADPATPSAARDSAPINRPDSFNNNNITKKFGKQNLASTVRTLCCVGTVVPCWNVTTVKMKIDFCAWIELKSKKPRNVRGKRAVEAEAVGQRSPEWPAGWPLLATESKKRNLQYKNKKERKPRSGIK